jgi:hypothetical protein
MEADLWKRECGETPQSEGSFVANRYNHLIMSGQASAVSSQHSVVRAMVAERGTNGELKTDG